MYKLAVKLKRHETKLLRMNKHDMKYNLTPVKI